MPRLESAVKDLRPSRDGPIVIDDLRANTGFMGGGGLQSEAPREGIPLCDADTFKVSGSPVLQAKASSLQIHSETERHSKGPRSFLGGCSINTQ